MPAVATKPKKTSSRKESTSKKRRITPEDFQKFIFVSDPQISPVGDAVVLARKHIGEKNDYVTNLWIVDDKAAQPRQFTSGGKDSQPRWSPDGSRIAFVSGREKPKPQIYTISTEGGEATALTNFPEGSVGKMRWSPDGKLIAVSFREQDPDWTEAAKKERKEKGLSDPPREIDHFWYRLDGDGYFIKQRYELYLVDAETGEHRSIYRGDTMGGFSFDFSPDSRQLVVSTNRDKRASLGPWHDELLRINIKTGKATPIPNLPRGAKDHVRWSPDGKHIAYAGLEGVDSTYSTENVHLWICDPQKGNAKCLTKNEDYCLMAVAIGDTSEASFEPKFCWAADSKRLYMQIGWHGESHLASVKRSGGSITFHTSGTKAHNIGNISDDGKRMAMTVGDATHLDEVHIAQLSGGDATVRKATDFNAKLLNQLELSKPKSSWVKTADGTRCQVWTMLPPGTKNTTTKKHPAVLEIHGGPHGMYGVSFFNEFHVLAAAGYVVVFSNPRGSKGYGRDHTAAIRGDWGGADWVDMQAVIADMKEKKFIDPKRMGVMGGSYGGYMTNWIIGHTREFAGAITDRCVSNLVSMGGNSDYIDATGLYFPGNFWDKPEVRWKCSPIRQMGNCRTPTLIIHSEGDLRCNVEQAEQVHAVLIAKKVPTRFVRYPKTTSHGMSRNGPPDLRLHRLNEILNWWKKYLKK